MGCSKPLIRGSPPRMRGKVYKITPPWFSIRITPAYAGKRRCPRFRPGKTRDHPRVCGEKPLQSSVNCTMEGLPPRMRGKVISSLQCDFLSGITPACAGKSFWPCTVLPRCRDHPRVCGEKAVAVVSSSFTLGSPPRVRGKGDNGNMQIAQAGITPACAGKSICFRARQCVRKDHPRVCGEKGRQLVK